MLLLGANKKNIFFYPKIEENDYAVCRRWVVKTSDTYKCKKKEENIDELYPHFRNFVLWQLKDVKNRENYV